MFVVLGNRHSREQLISISFRSVNNREDVEYAPHCTQLENSFACSFPWYFWSIDVPNLATIQWKSPRNYISSLEVTPFCGIEKRKSVLSRSASFSSLFLMPASTLLYSARRCVCRRCRRCVACHWWAFNQNRFFANFFLVSFVRNEKNILFGPTDAFIHATNSRRNVTRRRFWTSK